MQQETDRVSVLSANPNQYLSFHQCLITERTPAAHVLGPEHWTAALFAPSGAAADNGSQAQSLIEQAHCGGATAAVLPPESV